MNSEDNLKRSLQEKIASKDFGFDEANWDKARAMIDDSRKPRRVVPFFLAGAALVIVLLGTFFLLSGTDAAPAQPEISHAINEAPAVTAAPETPVASVEKAPKPSSPKTISSTHAPLTETTHSAKPKDAMPAPHAIQEHAETPVATKPSPLVTTLPPDETEKAAHAKGHPGSVNTTIPGIAADPSAGTPQPVTKATPIAQDPVEKDEPFATTDPVQQTGKDNATVTSSSKQPEVKPHTNSPEQFASDVKPPVAAAQESPAPMTEQVLPQGPEEPAATIAASDTSGNDQSIAKSTADTTYAPLDNDKGELGKPKRFTVLASIEAGANYMTGWKNPGSVDARGFNPTFGVNCFLNHLAPKTSLSFGLHYFEISHLSYSSYTSKVIRRSFGEESKVTVFTPVKAYYLMVPLRFNYHLSPMNTIGMGCNVSYLLDVYSEVETYTEKFNTRTDVSKHKAKGYTEGFKKYDAQVSLFYNRKLYPNLGVNVEVFYGITDVKNNAVFNSNVFERNTGLKLTLVYNFLKK